MPRALLNVNARVAKSSIYYCEYHIHILVITVMAKVFIMRTSFGFIYSYVLCILYIVVPAQVGGGAAYKGYRAVI